MLKKNNSGKKKTAFICSLMIITIIAIVIGMVISKNEKPLNINDGKSGEESEKNSDTKEDEEITNVDEKQLTNATKLANAIGITDQATIAQIASIPELAESADMTKAVQDYPTLTYIGHASIKLKSVQGDVIYIDPYYDGDYCEPADYILVTHAHNDHNKISQCTQAEGCKIIHWYDAFVNGEYKTFEFDHVKIEAVPSGDNANHNLWDNVGYIVTIDGVSVFHAGDTSMNEGKKVIAEKNIDYAMYPVDGTYNMGPEEATEVADLIGATYNIPIHGDGHRIIEQAMDFSPKGKLVVMIGQTIELK